MKRSILKVSGLLCLLVMASVAQAQTPGDVVDITAESLANGAVATWANGADDAGNILPNDAQAIRSTFTNTSLVDVGQVDFTADSPRTNYYWNIQPLPADVTDATFSIEAWINPDAPFNGGWTSIVAIGNAQENKFMELAGQSANWGWRSNDGGFRGVAAPAGFVGKWHHLVVTYDGTTAKFYANGAEALSEARALTIASGANSRFRLSGMAWDQNGSPDGWNMFNGKYARVRLHSTVLTPTQVLDNYNAEATEFATPLLPKMEIVSPGSDTITFMNSGDSASVVVKNTGDADLTVSDISLSGADLTDFQLVVTPGVLGIGESITAVVTFQPGAAGEKTAALDVTSDGGNGSVALRGDVDRWYVSTTGDDGSDGLTALTPFLTFSKAKSVASRGDVIQFADGNYDGNPLEDFGTGYHLILLAENPGLVTLTTTGPRHLGNVAGNITIISEGVNLHLASAGWAMFPILNAGSKDLSLNDCSLIADGAYDGWEGILRVQAGRVSIKMNNVVATSAQNSEIVQWESGSPDGNLEMVDVTASTTNAAYVNFMAINSTMFIDGCTFSGSTDWAFPIYADGLNLTVQNTDIDATNGGGFLGANSNTMTFTNVTLTGGGAGSTAVENKGFVFWGGGAKNVALDNCVISNFKHTAAYFYLADGSITMTNTLWVNNAVSGDAAVMFFGDGSTADIDSCWFSHPATRDGDYESAIDTWENMDSITIRNSVIEGGDKGIVFENNVPRLLQNNTFIGVTGSGVAVSMTGGAVMTNNVVLGYDELFEAGNDWDVSSSNNFTDASVDNPFLAFQGGAAFARPAAVSTNPAALRNYRPTAASVLLIDQGADLSGTVDNDFDGNARPQDAGYDIGAFEYVPGAEPTATPEPPTPTPIQPTETPLAVQGWGVY